VSEAPRVQRPGPDVILVVVDSLRADHLTQYGHPLPTSTRLGKLTERATRFAECYSPAPWTVPAVTSLFTGLAPDRHGVDAVGASLARVGPTLAETLREAGWQTAGFSFNPHISRRARFERGFDYFVDHGGRASKAPDIRHLTRLARGWVERSAGAPFFLYLQPMNTHGPYAVPDDARAALLGRPPAPGFEFFGPLMKELMNRGKLERRLDVTPELVKSLSEQYDTAVHHTSHELGLFFEWLDARGSFDDSLVVLTADHGEELFDHGGFAHRYSLHREVLRVPLFVKLQGQRAAREVAEPVSLVDLHPTLLDLLGLPAGPSDGRSLAPFLRPADGTPGAGTSGAVPAELQDRRFVARASNPKRCEGRSLRTGDFELHVIDRNYEGLENAVRLYDLGADPAQQRDVSAERPDVVGRLRAELAALADAYREGAFELEPYALEPAEREALEALGYTQP
jgi:arylsulfatase A-like enzyme